MLCLGEALSRQSPSPAVPVTGFEALPHRSALRERRRKTRPKPAPGGIARRCSGQCSHPAQPAPLRTTAATTKAAPKVPCLLFMLVPFLILVGHGSVAASRRSRAGREGRWRKRADHGTSLLYNASLLDAPLPLHSPHGCGVSVRHPTAWLRHTNHERKSTKIRPDLCFL